ncbi:MAG: hypothetical protein PVH31_09065, partial [Ectothiorhodospiraceae bacterium]
LSALDAMLDQPMEEVLDTLPLSAPLALALSEHGGPLGQVLSRTLSHEAGDWRELRRREVDIPLSNEAYLEALRWAEDNGDLLNDIQR